MMRKARQGKDAQTFLNSWRKKYKGLKLWEANGFLVEKLDYHCKKMGWRFTDEYRPLIIYLVDYTIDFAVRW